MGNGMNKILPGLYIGNIRDSKDRKQLDENNITHILSIHDNATPVLPDKKYLCIVAADTPDQQLTSFFRKCSKFIHEARLDGGTVLVHCLAGISRSVTVSCAYIMTATPHTYRHTLNAVRQARNVANPNFGFQMQLQKFQDNLLEKEREWFHSNFGPNPLKDAEAIEQLYNDYLRAEESSSQTAPPPLPPRGSGSNSSSRVPLNKQEITTDVAWVDKRNAVILDEDNLT